MRAVFTCDYCTDQYCIMLSRHVIMNGYGTAVNFTHFPTRGIHHGNTHENTLRCVLLYQKRKETCAHTLRSYIWAYYTGAHGTMRPCPMGHANAHTVRHGHGAIWSMLRGLPPYARQGPHVYAACLGRPKYGEAVVAAIAHRASPPGPIEAFGCWRSPPPGKRPRIYEDASPLPAPAMPKGGGLIRTKPLA